MHFRPRRFRRSTAESVALRSSLAPTGPDRSALLAELEVNVPAPERIVRWETATTTCETCTEPVARGAIRCRHCGATLPSSVLDVGGRR